MKTRPLIVSLLAVAVFAVVTAPAQTETVATRAGPIELQVGYFRAYGPTEAYFDKSWKLPDIGEVK